MAATTEKEYSAGWHTVPALPDGWHSGERLFRGRVGDTSLEIWEFRTTSGRYGFRLTSGNLFTSETKDYPKGASLRDVLADLDKLANG